jgi:hypothetical protein
MVEPSRCCCAVGPSEDDGAWWDAHHGRFKRELDIAGKMFEGVEGDPEGQVNQDLETLGLARDEAVAANTVFTGVNPGNVRRMVEGKVIHVDANPS